MPHWLSNERDPNCSNLVKYCNCNTHVSKDVEGTQPQTEVGGAFANAELYVFQDPTAAARRVVCAEELC